MNFVEHLSITSDAMFLRFSKVGRPYLSSISVTLLNQRTSGPVKAHLTTGPGIYFNVFIHIYIASGQGQTTPLGQMLMSTESPYHFAHLLQALK